MDESKRPEAQLRNLAHRLRAEAEMLDWLLGQPAWTETNGETLTCEPQYILTPCEYEWRECIDRDAQWCLTHRCWAWGCRKAGSQRATESSTKADILAAELCPTSSSKEPIGVWCQDIFHRGAQASEKASIEAPTPPSSLSGQTTPPTFHVEPSCGCAPLRLRMDGKSEVQGPWNLRCQKCHALWAYVQITAPAAPETGSTSPSVESTP